MKTIKQSYLWFALIIISIIVVDLLVKQWIIATFPVGRPTPLIGTVLFITHVHNTGGAFGLFSNLRPLFIIMGIIVPVLILIFYRKLFEKGEIWIIAAALITGGAIGNEIDRVMYGYVIDFLDVRFWPIFNVADIGISAGIVLLFIALLTEKQETETQKTEKQE
ncbi:MAG: signal peptidase II [Candidatus Xenobiia bacterium LiM19]